MPIRLSHGTSAGSGRPTADIVQAGSPTVPVAAMRRAAVVAAGEVYHVVVACACVPDGSGFGVAGGFDVGVAAGVLGGFGGVDVAVEVDAGVLVGPAVGVVGAVVRVGALVVVGFGSGVRAVAGGGRCGPGEAADGSAGAGGVGTRVRDPGGGGMRGPGCVVPGGTAGAVRGTCGTPASAPPVAAGGCGAGT
ncbi:hypothetical protein ABTX34_18650 [Streptomyces sp. NPDC096538]|uniref:hypothetical protein n=1 Tax=Streptomyces sp. NPDC096538 TaxID=3155427 RepID=UPI0033179A0D